MCGKLCIYPFCVSRWAAQLPCLPRSLTLGKFWDSVISSRREGLLVLLGEAGDEGEEEGAGGELSVCYLGTNPALHTPPPPDSREVNYEETDR